MSCPARRVHLQPRSWDRILSIRTMLPQPALTDGASVEVSGRRSSPHQIGEPHNSRQHCQGNGHKHAFPDRRRPSFPRQPISAGRGVLNHAVSSQLIKHLRAVFLSEMKEPRSLMNCERESRHFAKLGCHSCDERRLRVFAGMNADPVCRANGYSQPPRVVSARGSHDSRECKNRFLCHGTGSSPCGRARPCSFSDCLNDGGSPPAEFRRDVL